MNVKTIYLLFIALLLPRVSQAQLLLPQDFTVEGRLYDTSSTPIDASVNIMLEILIDNTSSANCVIYSETQSNINLASTDPTAIGVFALRLGTGTVNVGSSTLSSYFQTGTFTGQNDISGTACTATANAGDHRLLRIKSQLLTAASWDTLSPDTRISPVPSAMVADSANSLQGLSAANFIQVGSGANSALTQSNVANVFSTTNYPTLTTLLAGGYISSTPTSTVNLNGQRLTDLGTPTATSDATTKSYVDGDLGGKTLNLTGIAAGAGGGEAIVWDQVAAQWVAQSVGSVSAVGAGTGLIGGPITGSGTLSVDVGTAANKILQLNSLAQIPAVDGSLLSNLNATRIATRTVASTPPTSAQVLTYNGATAQWQAQTSLAITALSGDVVASGPGSVSSAISDSAVTTTKIADGAITSSKISTATSAVNRLLITDAATGTSVGFGGCSSAGQIYQWSAGGWVCADGSLLTNVSAAKIQNQAVSTATPTQGQVLTYSGSQWVAQTPTGGGASFFANGGNSFGNTAVLGTSDNNNLVVVTNGSPVITVTTGGRVGIGTTAPGQTLDLAGGNIALNYEIKTQNCGSYNSTCTASCTTGKQVIGGGCAFSTSGCSSIALLTNSPSGATSWSCYYTGSGCVTYTTIASAICAHIQ